MKNECNIIRDILPLYAEDMVSEDTRTFVESHLAVCESCSEKLNEIKKTAEFIADTDAAPLKKLKRKLRMKKVQTILFTAALVCSVILSVVSVLTAPQYIPYSDGLFHITERTDGTVILTFDESVTGYTFTEGDAETSGGIEICYIEAWNTAWDLHFIKRGEQSIVFSADKPIAVYYLQNNGEDDVFIYGTNPNPNGGMRTLPRLVLGQYLILAIFAAVICSVLLFVFRRNENVKVWLERILLAPISYILAHICTKGLLIKTFAMPRDFLIIILVGIFVYCVLLLGMNLLRSKKDIYKTTL